MSTALSRRPKEGEGRPPATAPENWDPLGESFAEAGGNGPGPVAPGEFQNLPWQLMAVDF